MKKTLFFASILLILSCSSDDNGDNNQFLPPSSVNYQINLNLPQFNPLKFPSNHLVDNSENGSIKGVIIYNIDNTQYSNEKEKQHEKSKDLEKKFYGEQNIGDTSTIALKPTHNNYDCLLYTSPSPRD